MAGKTKRYYGVKGHPDAEKNKVYDTWDECSAVVKGVSGVQYKGFGSREDAEQFIGTEKQVLIPDPAGPWRKNPHGLGNSGLPPTYEELHRGEDGFSSAKANEALRYLSEHGLVSAQTAAEISEGIRARTVSGPGAAGREANGTGGARVHAQDKPPVTMYVDGSYNNRTERCGFGIYITGLSHYIHGRSYPVDASVLYGSVPHANGGRNVEGEVTAAWIGLEHLKDMKLTGVPITVYHDYEGVGKWADGRWAANKSYTQAYVGLVKELRDGGMDVQFEHVDGHTGVDGNEMVDKLAKMGCDVHFAGEAAFVEKLDSDSRNHLVYFGAPIQRDAPVHEDRAAGKETTMEDLTFGG